MTAMTQEQKGLKACPCGKVPSKLNIQDANQGGKWANVAGDCCSEWSIEFRTQYHGLDSPECIALAVESWNEAPRAPSPVAIPEGMAGSEPMPGLQEVLRNIRIELAGKITYKQDTVLHNTIMRLGHLNSMVWVPRDELEIIMQQAATAPLQGLSYMAYCKASGKLLDALSPPSPPSQPAPFKTSDTFQPIPAEKLSVEVWAAGGPQGNSETEDKP